MADVEQTEAELALTNLESHLDELVGRRAELDKEKCQLLGHLMTAIAENACGVADTDGSALRRWRDVARQLLEDLNVQVANLLPDSDQVILMKARSSATTKSHTNG